jgi:hypothetical protein
VDVFNKIVEKRRCQLNYVIPISDNGGSSSELIRFVGGPSKYTRHEMVNERGRSTDSVQVLAIFGVSRSLTRNEDTMRVPAYP